jgi:hypothetical protein
MQMHNREMTLKSDVENGLDELPIVSHLSVSRDLAHQDPRKVARPARIELAAPRLGGGCSIP